MNCKKITGQKLNDHLNLLILNIYPVNAENITAMSMVRNYLKEKMSSSLNKKIFIAIIIIILFLIWAELGVGIFGTRFAGD